MTDATGGSPWGDDDRPVVLVHGAWVGEWSWLPVMPALRRSGRTIHAVSLTGHGARRHLAGPHIGLADHVADVVNLIEVLDLSRVTLVGHSYGGKVITQVAAQVADRLSAVVYVDGHAPIAEDPGQPAGRAATAEENGGMLPFGMYELDPALFGGEAGVRWCLDRIVDQPWATFSVPWQAPLPDHVTKTFIYALDNNPSRFDVYGRTAAAADDWGYHELDGPHFLMHSHPAEVADIILNA